MPQVSEFMNAWLTQLLTVLYQFPKVTRPMLRPWTSAFLHVTRKSPVHCAKYSSVTLIWRALETRVREYDIINIHVTLLSTVFKKCTNFSFSYPGSTWKPLFLHNIIRSMPVLTYAGCKTFSMENWIFGYVCRRWPWLREYAWSRFDLKHGKRPIYFHFRTCNAQGKIRRPHFRKAQTLRQMKWECCHFFSTWWDHVSQALRTPYTEPAMYFWGSCFAQIL